ncbi:hypothetical protein QTN47_13600 [Danxiaibacter flavus]|uniref:Uncharacterized protein n=1 Tax=Danxiaibacter flavus TaxID=3049108 RepID=A0ABV3ZF88_9BACT|nr:hypothetical protein QNM32_13605 [Chitinophagaceae bacterium DXS]
MKLSFVNQFLQLIGVAFSGFAFSYVAGLYLSVGLDISDSFEVNFGLGISKYDLSINNEPENHIVTINIVALALIYWIDKRSKKLAEEKNFAEVSSIGMNE